MDTPQKRRMVLRRPKLSKAMPPIPGRREGACSITDLDVGEEFYITPDSYVFRVAFIKMSAHTAEVSSWDDRCVFKQHFPAEYPIYRK